MSDKYPEYFLRVRAQFGFRQVGKPSTGIVHVLAFDDKTLCGRRITLTDVFDGECFQSNMKPTCKVCRRRMWYP